MKINKFPGDEWLTGDTGCVGFTDDEPREPPGRTPDHVSLLLLLFLPRPLVELASLNKGGTTAASTKLLRKS